MNPIPVPPTHGAPPQFPSDWPSGVDGPPWTAAESALDEVKVPSALGKAAAAWLEALGLPCQTTPSSRTLVFLVPAGSGTLPWPPPVTYLTGGLWPIAALDASYRSSDAYRALVTPPTALCMALAALSGEPAPDSSPLGAGDTKPSHGAMPPDGRARQSRGDW